VVELKNTYESRIRLLRRAADRLEATLSNGEFVSPSRRTEVIVEIHEVLAAADFFEELGRIL
jgi:hypothetical protein